MEHLTLPLALATVLQHSPATRNIEMINLNQAVGRVLAKAVCANRNLPPFDISAMDGYAVRSADVQLAPVSLNIIEDIKAGDLPQYALEAGMCARIMTGAPLPAGADAVIRVEDTALMSPQQVSVLQPVPLGNDVRYAGESMKEGEVVLQAGTEITPGVLGVLATVKQQQVAVYRRPRVAILSTGNELEAISEAVDPNKIPDANSYTLMAQLQMLGIEPVLLGIARDAPDELRDYLQRGLDFDVLLVSGGTSIGVHDYVRPTIESLGAEMLFWRVAIKPGHPIAFGKVGATLLFGLPGNPVSSMVCFELLVLPALRQIMAYPARLRRQLQVQLAHPIKHRAGRAEFVRATLQQQADGAYVAYSTGPQGSGMLLSMAQAHVLLEIPAEMADAPMGCHVTAHLLDGAEFA